MTVRIGRGTAEEMFARNVGAFNIDVAEKLLKFLKIGLGHDELYMLPNGSVDQFSDAHYDCHRFVPVTDCKLSLNSQALHAGSGKCTSYFVKRHVVHPIPMNESTSRIHSSRDVV